MQNLKLKILLLSIIILIGCKQSNQNQSSYNVTITPNYDYELTPLQQGLKLFGEYESIKGESNKSIDNIIKRFIPSGSVKTTPWCSAFIIECALSTGYEHSNSLAARSWTDIGECSIDAPKPGDVCVLWRENINSWKGHVGFFIKYNKSKTKVLLYGGNQGNRVTFKWFPATRVLGIKRLRKLQRPEKVSQYKIGQ